MDMERAASSIFIKTPGYGTRCSTVLLVGVDGKVLFAERNAQTGDTVTMRFELTFPRRQVLNV